MIDTFKRIAPYYRMAVGKKRYRNGMGARRAFLLGGRGTALPTNFILFYEEETLDEDKGKMVQI